MDAELKQALEAMEGRIGQRFDGLTTSVDGKLAFMDEKLVSMDEKLVSMDEKLVSMDEKLVSMDEKTSAMEARLVERIHDSETKLLTAFYNWARPVDFRINKQLPAMDERLGLLESRIFDLERKNLERGI